MIGTIEEAKNKGDSKVKIDKSNKALKKNPEMATESQPK
jgi:hypothetical protein